MEKFEMKKTIWYSIIFVAILVSCYPAAIIPGTNQIASTETAMPLTETPIPSLPTLEPATKFDEGVSQVPNGYFIFIEIRTYSICSSECQCAPGPVRQLYDVDSSGVLWTDLFNLDQILTKPIIGFFGFGDWRDQLYVIDSLPYRIPPYDAAIVHSIDDKGIVVMEYYGKTFYIKPSESWTNNGKQKREPPIGCIIDYGSTLTNYGLLSRTKIQLGDPYSHK
jgi:hypothetical protein